MMDAFKLHTLIVLLCVGLLGNIECAHVLGVYGFSSTSHKIIVTSVLKELASRGHQVTVITPLPENENRANYTEVLIENVYDLTDDDRPNMFEIVDYISPLILTVFMWSVGLDVSETTLKSDSVQKLINDPTQHFDLIIMENFHSEAFVGFSYKYEAPLIGICTFSGSEETGDSVGDPFPYSYVQNVYYDFSDHMTFYQRLQNTVLNFLTKLGRIYYYLPRQEAIMRKYFSQEPNSPSLTEIYENTSLLLLNSHFSYSFPRPHVPNALEVGGLHIKPPKKLTQDLQKFLEDSSEGVIYFSMGSNLKSAEMPVEKKQVFLKAFARLRQNVLWKFEDESLQNVPKNVRIEKWLPQSDLLAHPNIRVFMTHGGLLSTQEAIYHGVPLVGIPVYADQTMNVKKAVQTGYAKMLLLKDISEDDVYSTLTEIINDHRYRDNAKQVSRTYHDQPETPMDRAIFWIEYVLRHKGAPHLRSAALDLNWYQYYLLDVIGLLILITVLVVTLFVLLLRTIYRKLTVKSKNVSKSSKKKN